jgi:predicted MFS family arabinose efflux permease
MSGIGRKNASRVVWQVPQAPIPVTMYRPRSSSLSPAFEADSVIGAKAATGASLVGLFTIFLLLPLTLRPGVLISLGFGIASAVAQIFFPAQQAGLVSDFPMRRTTVLAWNNSSLFLGIALGSLIGGQILMHGSFETSLLICAAIALVGWLINWMVLSRPATIEPIR